MQCAVRSQKLPRRKYLANAVQMGGSVAALARRLRRQNASRRLQLANHIS